ncbi:MAG TPA: hypothetical protein VNA31_01585 [bacterium]|nr:hypothetical protein [bacterium]
MNTIQSLVRVGVVAAFVGAPLLLVSTVLHPSNSDPNVPLAAFTEYAASSRWVWIHLGQFAGVVGLGVSFTALAATMEAGASAAWARVGLLGIAVTIAVAATLQAVDGVALKVMVDRWAVATGDARDRAFEAAFAVRQIEIGLASLLSLVTGFTLAVFALAIILGARYPMWLGWIGLVDGVGTVGAGMAQASTGFSGLSMMLSTSTSIILLVWALATGALMWRVIPQLSEGRRSA